MAALGPDSSSVKDERSITFPEERLDSLIKSIEKLTGSVELLQRTVTRNDKLLVRNDAIPQDQSVSSAPESSDYIIKIIENHATSRAPWVEVPVDEEEDISRADGVGVDAFDAALSMASSSFHKTFPSDRWKCLSAFNWEQYARQSGVAKSELDSSQSGHLIPKKHSHDDGSEMPPAFEKSKRTSFRSGDLCLEVLRKVGKLKIEWTDYLDQHLDLNIKDSTLKIFWLGFSIKASPVFHLACDQYRYIRCHSGNPSMNSVSTVLQQTYILLFRSQKDNNETNIAEYSLLSIPPWIRVFYGYEKGTLSEGTAGNMGYFTRMDHPWLSDIEEHTEDLRTAIPTTQLFEEFQIFEDRLRMLQAYMDSQTPREFRGLWRGKRNGLSWYTFWAVVVFGGLGLLPAF